MEKFIYETPQTEVVEIFAEGVLCESTQMVAAASVT